MISTRILKRRARATQIATVFNFALILGAGYLLYQTHRGQGPIFMADNQAALQLSGFLAIGTLAIILTYFRWQKEVIIVAAQLHPDRFDPELPGAKRKWFSSKRLKGIKQIRLLWRVLHELETLPWWKNPVTILQILFLVFLIMHRIAMRSLLWGKGDLVSPNMELLALVDLIMLGGLTTLFFFMVRLVTNTLLLEKRFEETAETKL